MSSTGRRNDGRAGGGAPRAGSSGDPAACPFCRSDETERISLFGSTLLVSQHYCRSCRTVFEKLKR